MKLGKLYGIGVGPGDPELLTVKAVGVIKRSPVICAPRASVHAESFALSIVKGYVDLAGREVLTVLLPMSMDKAVLEKAWSDAAAEVAKRLEDGKDVAFLTLGDPSLYSTYAYVLSRVKERLPEVESETVSGVSSISLAAARAGVDLAQGGERLAVMPVGRDMEAVERALEGFDTVVLMKVNRNFPKLVELLDKKGLLDESVYVSRCGTQNEKVIRDLVSIGDSEHDYLSLVIVKTRKK